jgi:hypothetical protein
MPPTKIRSAIISGISMTTEKITSETSEIKAWISMPTAKITSEIIFLCL